MIPRYHKKIIQITALDSPNVKLGLEQRRLGLKVTKEKLVDGVLTLDEYDARRKTWDPIRQCVGLDAKFYAGPEIYLFPKPYLKTARALWAKKMSELRELAFKGTLIRWMGVDPAEGGDHSAWVIIDKSGVLKVVSMPTPNTNVVWSKTLELMRNFNILPENVVFDRGGGGKPHADRLQMMGIKVRTVAFSETMAPLPQRAMRQFQQKVENFEDRTLYKNRRVEMYWEAAALFDPLTNPAGYALCPDAENLRIRDRKTLLEQLAIIPKEYDEHGRPYLRPKQRKPGQEEQKHKTLTELIGHSPDEADAMVLAIYGMLNRPHKAVAGSV